MCALALVACASVAAGSTPAATSSMVVGASVASAITLTNGCTSTTATSLGSMIPGSGVTTDTGAGKCTVSWSASNDSSMLRIAQRDGVGAAMSRPTSWSGSANWDRWTSVDTADGSNAIAGGNGGDFGRTSTSGAAWTVTASLGGIGDEIAQVEQVPSDATGAWAVGTGDRVQRITNALGVPVVTSRRAQLVAAGLPAGIDIDNVAVIDSDSAIVAGENGWIARTDDDGLTWSEFQMPSTGDVQGLTLAPTGHVWMITTGNAGGNFWRAPSTGGGVAGDWTQFASGAGIALEDIVVTSATQGYAVGGSGAIYSWNGTSWTWRGDDFLEPSDILDVSSPAGNPGTAVATGADGSILRTTTSGLTWTRVASPTGEKIGDVASGSAGMLLVGYGRVTLASTDGNGASWTHQSDSTSARARTAVALEPVDGKVALAVGSRGTIWRSTDGGTSWSIVTSGTTEPLFGVTFATRSLVWAVGAAGTILRSDDAGQTWSSVTSGTSVRLRSVSSGAPEQMIASGDDGRIVRTTNGGTTFSVSTVAGGRLLEAVSMGSRLAGIVVTEDVILRTTNGGATWSAPSSSPAIDHVTSVSMADANTAYASSAWNAIWKTTNGGDTWTRTAHGMGEIHSVHAVTPTLAFASGGEIWMTTNGTSWTEQTNTSWTQTSVAASDENHVIMGSDVGVVGVRKASIALANQIPDYGAAPNSWNTSSEAMFGVCLQAVGALTDEAAPWIVDGGTCTASDSDPWRAVPITPTKIAGVPVLGDPGQVDLVWGVRFPAAQAPGRYSAGVAFEVIAPNA